MRMIAWFNYDKDQEAIEEALVAADLARTSEADVRSNPDRDQDVGEVTETPATTTATSSGDAPRTWLNAASSLDDARAAIQSDFSNASTDSILNINELMETFHVRDTPDNGPGSVYVFKDQENRFMVGCSRDVDRRLALLQVGNPDIDKEAEYRVHRRLDALTACEDLLKQHVTVKHIGGEWFSCPLAIVLALCGEVCKEFEE